jgi:hypothetical protein
MSDVQFQTKDWNPFSAAANLLDSLNPKHEEERNQTYKRIITRPLWLTNAIRSKQY